MKILFCNQHTGSGTYPLASAALAAALERGFSGTIACPILELAPDFSHKEVIQRLQEESIDLVALSLYTWSLTSLLELAQELKERYPDIPVIAGGPEVTANPLNFASLDYLDLCLPGEGEDSLLRLLKDQESSERPLKDFLKEQPNPYPRGQVEDLDALPSPFQASHLKGKPYGDMLWELTRGCPFKCHFCFESKGDGQIRGKSLSIIQEELQELLDRKATEIFILDPTFNYKPQRAKEILRLFIAKAPDLHYHIEVRSEFLDEEQAQLFSQLQCSLQIGLQSAHPHITTKIGRPFDPQDFQDKLYLLHEAGVPYGIDLIYGLPGDTLEGFYESLDFALSCAPNHLDVFPLAVLPGTRLAETAQELGLRYTPAPPYLVEDRQGFTREDLDKAGGITQKINILYNQGKGVTWFGYLMETLGTAPLEALKGYSLTGADTLEEIRSFTAHLCLKTGQETYSHLLQDAVTLLFALNEEDQAPLLEYCRFQPEVLWENLEQGITDPDELLFFTPKREP